MKFLPKVLSVLFAAGLLASCGTPAPTQAPTQAPTETPTVAPTENPTETAGIKDQYRK